MWLKIFFLLSKTIFKYKITQSYSNMCVRICQLDQPNFMFVKGLEWIIIKVDQ